MKINVKQMDKLGNEYLVNLMTDDDVIIKADITSRNKLDETLLDFRGSSNSIILEKYTYEEYLEQDERR